MRTWFAGWMLLLVGLALPAAGGPARVCLGDLLPAAVEEESGDCCPDCDPSGSDPCCVELDELPDVVAPAVEPDLPLPPLAERGAEPLPAPAAPSVPGRGVFSATPIRGPTSPAAYRATLEIWLI